MPLVAQYRQGAHLLVVVPGGVVAAAVEAVDSPDQVVDLAGKASFDLARPSARPKAKGNASHGDSRSTLVEDIGLVAAVVVEARSASPTCAVRHLAPSSSPT